MKGKKEYIILALVISVLCIYLAMRRSDKTHYTLPETETVAASALEKVEIAKTGGTFTLIKKDEDKWYLEPGSYPLDKERVTSILENLSEIRLTALLSDSESYERYEVGKEKGIFVKAWADGREIRNLIIGKTISHSHTCVKLNDDPRVYQASGDLRRDLAGSMEELRDRKVLSFDKQKVREVTLSAGSQKVIFTRKKHDDEGQDKDLPATWVREDGSPEQSPGLSSLLDTLSNLSCSTYLKEDKKKDLVNPEYVITIDGDKKYTLTLFSMENKEATDYPALSSATPYPFKVPVWKLEDKIKALIKI